MDLRHPDGRRARLALPAVFLFLVGTPVGAQDSWWDAMGWDAMLSDLQTAVVENLAVQAGDRGAPATAAERAGRRLAEAFQPDRLTEDTRASIDTELASPPQLLAWWSSPLGRRVAAVESAALESGAAPGLERFDANLKRLPVLPERLELAARLDQAQGRSRRQIALSLAVASAGLGTVEAILPPKTRSSRDAIDRQLAEVASSLQREIPPRVRRQVLFATRSLTLAELREYVALSETEMAGRAFREFERALEVALLAALDRAAQSISTS